jgi:uncharacterized protein (TIRG00374 family)
VTKQIFWIVVKYGLGLGLLAYVVWQYWSLPTDDGKENLGLVGAFDKPWNMDALLLAGLICLTSVLITFVRWYVLVRAQGLPFTLFSAFRLGLIGYYLSTFLPGSVGGDIIKAAQIARQQDRRTVAVATVILDRFIGLCGLIWLVAFLGGFFWWVGYLDDAIKTQQALIALETIVVVAWAVVLGSLGFWFLLGVLPARRAERLARWLERIPKIGHSFAEFWRAIYMYRCQGRSVLLGLLLSIVGHVGFVMAFYFAALTLNPADKIPSVEAHFLIVPVGMAIQGGFPSPGGVGGGEYGYGSLYSLFGFAFAAGVLGSLIRRVIDWVLGLAGYLIYLRMRPALRQAREEAAREEAAAAPSANGEAGPSPSLRHLAPTDPVGGGA